MDDIFKQLKEKHGEKYDNPRLRLWARSFCSKIHDDLNSPPDFPALCNEARPKKRVRKETLTDSDNNKSPQRTSSPPAQSVGISPVDQWSYV